MLLLPICHSSRPLPGGHEPGCLLNAERKTLKKFSRASPPAQDGCVVTPHILPCAVPVTAVRLVVQLARVGELIWF